MPSGDQNSSSLFAVLAAEISAADDVWVTAAEKALERLDAVDPELIQLALRALHSRIAAAAFFARKFVYVQEGSCYAALADGKRELVVARLRESIAGDAGAYV